MLGLFGKKSDHPLANIKSAQQVLEELPKNDAQNTVHELIGWIESITYRPDEHSKRGKWDWEHASGDRGLPFGLGNSSERPLLVADPRTGRPAIVMGKSPMKLNPRRGLVG